MKKKIIAIIACVSVIAGIFCISSNAINLKKGTEIYFNNILTDNYIDIEILFSSDLRDGFQDYYRITYSTETNHRLRYISTDDYFGVYVYLNDEWVNDYYNPRYIIVQEDTVLTDEQYQWIEDNAIINDASIKNAIENTNAMFGTTLSVMTVIITWLLANQIALCGLYLYILIACIGIGKRFVKT